jgi:hypothetical protein
VESSITASTPAISASAGPSKEASVSATATPIPDDSRANTPLPGKSAPYGQTAEEYFELAYYEDNEGRSFHKQKTGPFLRLAVNKQAKRVETSLREPVHMRIDPHEISRVIVEPLDDSNGAACVVSLLLNDGASGPKEQKLVFETSNAMGREETGRIHARRFCRWVKGVNGAIDYRNKRYVMSATSVGNQGSTILTVCTALILTAGLLHRTSAVEWLGVMVFPGRSTRWGYACPVRTLGL